MAAAEATAATILANASLKHKTAAAILSAAAVIAKTSAASSECREKKVKLHRAPATPDAITATDREVFFPTIALHSTTTSQV